MNYNDVTLDNEENVTITSTDQCECQENIQLSVSAQNSKQDKY